MELDATPRHAPRSGGVTLVELIVVLTLLIVLAGAIAANLSGATPMGQTGGTEVALEALRAGILGTAGAAEPCGYLADVGTVPARIRDLLVKPDAVPSFEPATGLGWRGPYCSHSSWLDPASAPAWLSAYWTAGDPVVLDGWSNPIVIQLPDAEGLYCRLVSAGHDRELQTPSDLTYPPKSVCGDDLVLYLRVADLRGT